MYNVHSKNGFKSDYENVDEALMVMATLMSVDDVVLTTPTRQWTEDELLGCGIIQIDHEEIAGDELVYQTFCVSDGVIDFINS
jgi:hypothetical protein